MLFEPLSIRGLTLKNRLVVPPMVHYRCDPGNTCGTFHVVHLGRYALGGFGLVFVEATGVEEIGLINEHDLGIWNDAQVESFKPLIAFMKRQGTAIGIQLAHGGRKASSQTAMQGMGPLTEENLKAGAKKWQPVGPTAEPVAKGWLTPRQLTTAECRAMVGTWAAAAKRAVSAGFDTIEIHTAHGYLLASFLSPVSNTRNDEYGGDRAGRMRLPLEIVEAVRREMPASMPLFLRVSSVDGTQEGWNMDDTVAFARELKARGVDVIDCFLGRYRWCCHSGPGAAQPRIPGALCGAGSQGGGHFNHGRRHHSRSAAGRSHSQERASRSHRDRPPVAVQSEYRASLGARPRHQRTVRGLVARIWLVAREADQDPGRLCHAHWRGYPALVRLRGSVSPRRHCEEPTGRANARPMTGSATKQSSFLAATKRSWIAPE
jgi:2,4-dienoyl-CoA reductase-like NADH-dependent reductase (Old Yellow Enzyme family)